MFEIDFSGMTDYLHELQKALSAVSGNLGQVKINDVTDPKDVERALADLEGIVDHAFAPYIGNPTVRGMAEQMKASYKEGMLEQVEAKKREISQSQTKSES
jgi:hypothetical protein